MTIHLYDLYQIMRSQRIMLSFNGTISQEVLVGLADLIREAVRREAVPQTVSKRVFGIFIEMAQNILLYSAERIQLQTEAPPAGTGIIVVSEADRQYAITSGNLIDLSQGPALQALCEEINRADEDSLRQMYRDRMRQARRTGHPGGGVGLIEIARKASAPLHFQLTPAGPGHLFFTLRATVRKENARAAIAN